MLCRLNNSWWWTRYHTASSDHETRESGCHSVQMYIWYMYIIYIYIYLYHERIILYSFISFPPPGEDFCRFKSFLLPLPKDGVLTLSKEIITYLLMLSDLEIPSKVLHTHMISMKIYGVLIFVLNKESRNYTHELSTLLCYYPSKIYYLITIWSPGVIHCMAPNISKILECVAFAQHVSLPLGSYA